MIVEEHFRLLRPPFRCLLFAVLPFFLIYHSAAFIISTDSAGRQRHWELSNPVAHTNVMNPATQSVRYFIGAFSRTNAPAELNALRSAFDQWQSVPETALKFEEGGLTAARDINVSDHTNTVIWTTKSLLVNGGRDNLSGVLAVTYPRFSEENVMLEADILLNGVQFEWFTDFFDTDNPNRFIESTVLHEIGHLIGLEHSPVGGATMFARADIGVTALAGLSSDDIFAVQTLYPKPNSPTNFGSLNGRVEMNGNPVFGALVSVETSAGNLIAGTLSNAKGDYAIPRLQPGDYRLRVTPLDPVSGGPLTKLVPGNEISLTFAAAQTGFLPSSNRVVSVTANQTNSVRVAVTAGNQPFRITRIRLPSNDPDNVVAVSGPVTASLGQTNLLVGVLSPDLPLSGAVLEITGDGLTTGPLIVVPDAISGSKPSLTLLTFRLDISTNATPGLRSFIVRHGSEIAYANGFLEILPPFPDFNFDRLDDTFQRRYFPRFTAPEAAPAADPDNDRFSNLDEYLAGSNPLDPQSLLRIESIKITAEGALVTWQSADGRRYQIYSRPDAAGGAWHFLGTVASSQDGHTEFLDPENQDGSRFYRVEVPP